jgi:hypothetical protein
VRYTSGTSYLFASLRVGEHNTSDPWQIAPLTVALPGLSSTIVVAKLPGIGKIGVFSAQPFSMPYP